MFSRGGSGFTVFQNHPVAERLQGAIVYLPLDLNPVGFWHFLSRRGDMVLQRAVVGQQQQAFGIKIQPAGGVE